MVAEADRHRHRLLAGLRHRRLVRVGLRRLLEDREGDLGDLVVGALVAGALVAGALVVGAQAVAQEHRHRYPWARGLCRLRVALVALGLALAQHVAGLVVGTQHVAGLAKRGL